MKEKLKKIVRRFSKRVDRKMQKLIDYIDLMQKLIDYIDLTTSSSIDVKDCKSVCLTLGPYRNLTTLTAATLFLHPNCQVLNHGGGRIFKRRQLDFLSDYSEEKFNRFIQYAIRISTKGKRGNYGGSIIFSHAFDDNHGMKEVFLSTEYGLLKKEIKCLFWKESLKNSNLIRKKNVDLGSIFEKNKRLRFILPIRNPLDCAISNIKTGHVNTFEGLNTKSTKIEVLQAILDDILWFAELQKLYPDRFFCYFEHEISRNMLVSLATFLQLEPLESWLNDAVSVMKAKSSYDHDNNFIAFYRRYVNDRFIRFPVLSAGLLFFIDKESNKSDCRK